MEKNEIDLDCGEPSVWTCEMLSEQSYDWKNKCSKYATQIAANKAANKAAHVQQLKAKQELENAKSDVANQIKAAQNNAYGIYENYMLALEKFSSQKNIDGIEIQFEKDPAFENILSAYQKYSSAEKNEMKISYRDYWSQQQEIRYENALMVQASLEALSTAITNNIDNVKMTPAKQTAATLASIKYQGFSNFQNFMQTCEYPSVHNQFEQSKNGLKSANDNLSYELKKASQASANVKKYMPTEASKKATAAAASNAVQIDDVVETGAVGGVSTTVAASAVAITGLVIGASCFLVNKNRQTQKVGLESSLIEH